MLTSEFVDMVIDRASDDFLCRFLDLDIEEVNKLWEEETLTDLQIKIEEAYQQMPEDELQEFVKELDI